MTTTFFTGIGMVLLMGVIACEKKEQLLTGSREGDEKELQELRQKIDSLSTLYPCEDASQWLFTAIGAKACGGPTGYVPYATQLDTADFLKLVKTYTALQAAFNKKHGVISDCAYETPPNHVVCDNGKPKLVWDRTLVEANVLR